MDRGVAEPLMKELMALGVCLNSMTVLTDKISDKEEQVEIRRVIGNIMGMIYTDMMIPIMRQYPDLNPDK